MSVCDELLADLRGMPPVRRGNPCGRIVLFVEDDPRDVETLKVKLEREGLRVDVAGNVSAATDKLEAREPYRMVLIDMILGNERGTKIVAYLRERMPEIPITILSGAVTEEMRLLGEALGYKVLDKNEATPEVIRQLFA